MLSRAKSKKLTYVLRHHPEELMLELDPRGWVSLAEVADKLGVEKYEIVSEVFRPQDKQRFELSEDGQYIRATHGHSVPGKFYRGQERVPPDFLFHGTTTAFASLIWQQGLLPVKRQYVHLTTNPVVARFKAEKRGRRVGDTGTVFTVDTRRARAIDQVEFYQTVGGIWLSTPIPPRNLGEELP